VQARALRQLIVMNGQQEQGLVSLVSIEGHTDSIGWQSYKLELSEHRADTVRQFSMAQGIEAGRIAAVGYGKAYPVASNNTEAGRQQNGRVEVVMQ
jgi:outer membrane protein OmpA-like peptidoglycan-associated protein